MDLEGELFFGAALELDRHFAELRERIKAGARIVVLRVKRTRNPDMVCMERFEHFIVEMQAQGITVLLCGVRADFAQAMKNLGFQDWLPADRVFLETPPPRAPQRSQRPVTPMSSWARTSATSAPAGE